jgi:dephospho-CoA kinase
LTKLPLRVVGLTGGIASGKSAVASMLRALGAEVIDADALAREVVAPGSPGLADVAARFPDVIDAAGQLDRAKLGQKVFANDGERAALNALLHPRIHALFAERVKALADAGARLAVYDVPLLFENGLERELDGAVVVWVPREIQRERLMRRNGLSFEEAEQRIAAQASLDDKRQRASWVIDNSKDLAATRAQVEQLWRSWTGTP